MDILDRLEATNAVVPVLWQSEVLNALLVAERRKLLKPSQSIDYLTRLAALDINFDALPPQAHRDAIIALGRNEGLSAYDATYLELAMRMAVPLASFDQKLLKIAKALGLETL